MIVATQMEAIRDRESHSKDGLLEYLSRFSGSQCSDPRDKIFALYGISELPRERCLAAAFQDGALRPDYNKTFPELCLAAARICVRSGNLDILSHSAAKSHTTFNLPSWVPDWSLGDPL